MSASERPHWTRQIVARLLYLVPLKAFGTMAFMALFFWGYFGVLRFPLAPATVMPQIAADAWIPFTPLAFPAYVSLWVYASLPPALLREFRTLALFGVWIAAMCLFCLGLFWLFPTAVPPSGIDWSLYPEMAVIKTVDTGGNACPSLHVAAAVFTALWLDRICLAIGSPAWLRWLNALQCLAILWSTVATRQHVVLDVVAGLVVGLAFALPALRHATGSLRAEQI